MTEPRELSYLVPVDALAEVKTAVTVLGNLRSGGHQGAAAARSDDHGGVEGREPGRGHRRRMAARPRASSRPCHGPEAQRGRGARRVGRLPPSPAYDGPEAVAGLAGAAPVTRRSGKHTSVSFR
jgi:hypothetical protein